MTRPWLGIPSSRPTIPPHRFFRCVATALEHALPGAGSRALALLDASPGVSPEATAAALLEDLAEQAREVVLVLDDYHLIQSRSIHDAVSLFLGRSPPRVHLVIASRTSPPLPLARMRARGELLELSATDLRFTVEEATAFLEEEARLRLPPGAAAALTARTEGWGAGLQLAALSVQRREEPATLLAAFTGSHRLVSDYLGSEVLEREPPEVQAFLLRSSTLERLGGALCDAVTGVDRARGARRRPSSPRGDARTSQRMLERLERENLFLVPLDDERRWWRYHWLFAEFLRRKLEDERQGELCELHERAARWLERNGFAAEAAAHAVEVRDFERAASLLEEAWRTGRIPARPSVVLGWLEALPPAVVRSRPRLLLMEAWALTGTGQWNAVEARLRGAVPAGPRSLEADASILRGFAAAVQGEARSAIRILSNARRLRQSDVSPLAFLHLGLGIAHESQGNAEAAREEYGRARALAEPGGAAAGRSAGSHPSRRRLESDRGPGGVGPFLASIWLGDMELARGSLREAARLFEDAAHLASWVGDGAPCAGWPQSGLGAVSYQWNDLDSAARQLDAAIELGSWSDFGDDVPVVAYAQLAHVRESQGDARAARRLAERSQDLMRRGHLSARRLVSMALALHARLWVRQGDLDAAARWAESHRKDAPGAGPSDEHPENAAWVRVMLAIGRTEDVTPSLQRWLHSARAAGLAGYAIELEMLSALTFGVLGRQGEALAALDRALARAKPEGWVRLFLDEGEPMARLLERAARRRSASSPYARGLLAAMTRRGGRSAAAPPAAGARRGEPLIEPLSRREREILALVADGLSNPELADRLLVGVATVKTHINHLFGKLGACSRTDAVARARRLGLV